MNIVQYRRHMYERVSKIAVLKGENPSRNSHAELIGYQSVEDGKRTRDNRPVHSSAAFANLSAHS